MADDTHTDFTVGVKQLSSLRVIDLKTELEKRGLSKSGSKRELLERLKRQLQLENLHQKSSQNEDHVPNLSLQDDALVSQNEVVKQYLAGQQKIYELQKEARRKIEQDDAYRASDTEASSSQDEGPSTKDAERNRKEEEKEHRALPVITLVQSKILSDDDKTQDQTELELGASGLVSDGLPDVATDQTASPAENLSKASIPTKLDAEGDPTSVSQKIEAIPSQPVAVEDVKDELALAVGSICVDRDVPLDLSEHTTARVEQSASPVFVDRAEQDRAALEAMEAAAVLENQIRRDPLCVTDTVAVSEDATVSSTGGGLNLDGSGKAMLSLGQESSEGVDETAEACRIISQSFIREESQPEKSSPEADSLADVRAQPLEQQQEEEGMGRIRRSQTKGQSETPAAATESPKSKRKYSLRGEKQATPNEKASEEVPEIPLPPQQEAPAEPCQGAVKKRARSSSGDSPTPEKAPQNNSAVKREGSVSPDVKTSENRLDSELLAGTIKREIPSPSRIQRRSPPRSPEENSLCSANLVKSEDSVAPEQVPHEPALKVELVPAEEPSSLVKEDASAEEGQSVNDAESVVKFEGPALPASIERANSRSRSPSRSKEESRKSRSPSPSKSHSRSSRKGRSKSPSPSRKKSRSALKSRSSKSPSPKASRRPRLKRGKKPDSRSPSPSKRRDRSSKRGKSKSTSPSSRRRDRSSRKKRTSRSPSPHRHREKSPKRRKSSSRTPSPSSKRKDKSPRHKKSKSRSHSPSNRKSSKQKASKSRSPSPTKTPSEKLETTEIKSRSSSPEKMTAETVLYSVLDANANTGIETTSSKKAICEDLASKKTSSNKSREAEKGHLTERKRRKSKSRSASPEKVPGDTVLYSVLEVNDNTEGETKAKRSKKVISEGLASKPDEKDSSNKKSETEKDDVPERKRRGSSSQKENVNPSAETSSPAAGEVSESGDALKESGHILDLHPGDDMDIGDNPIRTTERTSNEEEQKSHKKSSPSSDEQQQQRSHHPRNLSNRKLSLSGSRDSKEAANQEEGKPQRKRRWGALVKTSKSTPSISTECLKDLIPDYKPQLSGVLPLSPEDVKEAPLSPSGVHPAGEEAPPSDQRPQEENGVKAEPSRGVPLERRRTTSSSATPFGPQSAGAPAMAPPSPSSHKGLDMDSNAVLGEGRSLSPAKNPASRILFIRNLVRPFTLPQLKDMLGRTGSLVPDAFWIDKIKSKCYVMYESQEEAVSTRSALHGSRWPISNPKTLLVDFSTEEELNFHKQLGDSPGLPPPPPVAPSGHRLDLQQPPSQQQQHQRGDEHFPNSHRLAKNMTVVVSQDVPVAFPAAAMGRLATSRHHRDEVERGRSGNLANPGARGGRLVPAAPVREWDRDKLSQEPHAHRHHHHHKEPPGGKGSKGGDGDRPSGVAPSDRDRKERSSRREKKGDMSKKKLEEPPGKLLDDLFKKTKAIPCIYWLPLTDAALALREVEKKQWEVEREKRREKRQETGGPEGGSSGERSRPSRHQREALKPLPPPMLTGGNVAPLKGRDFSGGRSRSPPGRARHLNK